MSVASTSTPEHGRQMQDCRKDLVRVVMWQEAEHFGTALKEGREKKEKKEIRKKEKGGNRLAGIELTTSSF